TAGVIGLAGFIHHFKPTKSREAIKPENGETTTNDYSIESIESKLKLNDSLLKNKKDQYITAPDEFVSPLIVAKYRQALHYITQTRSKNFHIRERGLTHLALLDDLPDFCYQLIGQMLDRNVVISLARTNHANSNLFLHGVPYIFSLKKEETTASVKNVDDDDVLLNTIGDFLDKLKRYKIDTLSKYYLDSLNDYLNDIKSQTVFDLVQHFEPEHADTSTRAIKRYRSNLELYYTFLYALRGYCDRYPMEVIKNDGLGILRYLYEKRKDNVPFVRFICKLLILLSREKQTHEYFHAVGWIKILNEMSLNSTNIIYALLSSTILANLDRPASLIPPTSLSISKVDGREQSLEQVHEPKITKSELSKAENKSQNVRETVFEQDKSSTKTTESENDSFIGNFLRRFWYKQLPVSDEVETPDIIDDKRSDKEGFVSDIDTSHTTSAQNDVVKKEKEWWPKFKRKSKEKEEQPSSPEEPIKKTSKEELIDTQELPSWIQDQVYGDKLILMSPTMYDLCRLENHDRWHHEPMVDVVFIHGIQGSAFKTWRQELPDESIKKESKQVLKEVNVDKSEEEAQDIEEKMSPTTSKPFPLIVKKKVSDEASVEDNETDDVDETVDNEEQQQQSSIECNDNEKNRSKNNVPKSIVDNIKERLTGLHSQQEHSLCWPKDWLGKDLPSKNVRIVAVDYESTVSEWQMRSLPREIIRRSMKDKAQEIAEQLKQAGVGKRPIIWVAHSMGGLITKYVIGNEQNEELRSNTRACVFYSVPHFGAELASWGVRNKFLVRPTVEIEDLQPNSKNLLELHERFLNVLKQHQNIKILSFAENEKTVFSYRYQTIVVPAQSSQIDIGPFYVLNKNHVYICKPSNKEVIEYQELLDLIRSIYFERLQELKSDNKRTSENFLNYYYHVQNDLY
ncbi:unnamed protein product, partial [Didymodactylos carnosus]